MVLPARFPKMAISKDLGRQHKPVVCAPAARGGAFSARRHQHAGDRASHLRALSRPARARRVSTHQRLVGLRDAAAGGGVPLARGGTDETPPRPATKSIAKIEDYRDVMRRRADGYAASTVASMASAANASRKALVHGPIIQGAVAAEWGCGRAVFWSVSGNRTSTLREKLSGAAIAPPPAGHDCGFHSHTEPVGRRGGFSAGGLFRTVPRHRHRDDESLAGRARAQRHADIGRVRNAYWD